MMSKKMLQIIAASIVGNMIAERYLLKASPDDPTGFVMVSSGLGLDDVVRGAAIGVSLMAIDKVWR